jgi:ATP-dependent helicase HrpA
MELKQGRADAGGLSGAGGQGHACRDRGLRRARRRRAEAPRRPAPPGGAADREPLKYLEKNIPDLQKHGGAYMPLGTLEELREQIIDVALDRAFLAEPLPTDEAAFKAPRRRGPHAAEPDRRRGGAPGRRGAGGARRGAAQAQGQPAAEGGGRRHRGAAAAPGAQALPAATPWAALQHLPRYLKAVVLRLDKLRADPARDAERLAELRPLEQRWLRRVAELRARRTPGWTSTAGCSRNCA